MVVSKEKVKWAVRVVEPVQQHLGHLSFLLSDQPGTKTHLKLVLWKVDLLAQDNNSRTDLPSSLLFSHLPCPPQDLQKLRFVTKKSK